MFTKIKPSYCIHRFQAKPKPKHRFQDRFQDRFQQNAGRSTAFRTVFRKSSGRSTAFRTVFKKSLGRSTRNECGHSFLYLALFLCFLCALSSSRFWSSVASLSSSLSSPAAPAGRSGRFEAGSATLDAEGFLHALSGCRCISFRRRDLRLTSSHVTSRS